MPSVRPASGIEGTRSEVQAGAPIRRRLFTDFSRQYLLIAAYAAFGLTLMFSNPPGAAPDEEAHYLRAFGVGTGQVVLEEPGPLPPAPPELARQIKWLWMQTGMVEVPARYSTVAFECWARPFYLGDCSESSPPGRSTALLDTYVGTYPPFTYVLPGLLMRLGSDSVGALMWGRLGILAVAMAFLAMAVFALYGPGGLWLAGLIVAVTPMVLFMAASLSSSGVEIAAAVCFMACLLRLTRSEPAANGRPDGRKVPDAPGRTSSPLWVWIAAASSGAILSLSRDLGPAWVLLIVGLAAICAGWSGVRAVWKGDQRNRVWALLAVLAVSFVVAVAWRRIGSAPPDLSRLRFPNITAAMAGGLIRQVVGVFGPLDALMPEVAYRIWGLLGTVLLIAAFVVGTGGQRVSLAAAVVAAVVATYALEAAQNIYGFGVQARHVMPAVVCIPLLAGEIVARRWNPRWRWGRIALPLLVIGAASVHLAGWHTLARRYAVGAEGPAVFFSAPVWSPPGGWIPWAALASAACLVLVSSFVVPIRKEQTH